MAIDSNIIMTTTIEHPLTVPEQDSTFASVVPSVAKTNYADPIFKTISDPWLGNIYQDIIENHFIWPSSSNAGAVIRAGKLIPVDNQHPVGMPWFAWVANTYQAFKADWQLVLDIVKHSSHRGTLAVMCTFGQIDTNRRNENFAPVSIIDVSGSSGGEYVIDLPNYNPWPVKFPGPSIRTQLGDQELRPPNSIEICTVNVTIVSPLVASSMLPSSVDIFFKLRPKPGSISFAIPQIPNSAQMVNRTSFWPNT